MAIASGSTESLLKQRGEAEDKIRSLKDLIKDITYTICEKEGRCPHCNNWHYPYCGSANA